MEQSELQEKILGKRSIFIFDFNNTNPLGVEWALILSKTNNYITYVYKSNDSIETKRIDQVRSIAWESFRSRDFIKFSRKIVFLPWLPSRNQIPRLMMVLLRLRGVKVLWIDHNPIISRSTPGIIVWLLRKLKIKSVRRVVHRGVKDDFFSKSTLDVLHPVFFNYTETLKLPSKEINSVPNVLYFGRICKQKGADYLPEFLSKLDDYLVLKSERIKFSVVGTIDYKEPWILESISKLKLKSIELEIKASKQNVPEKYLIKKIHEADLVFAPYAHLTESGTASLAISQFIPVFFVGESAPFSLRLDVFRGFVVVAAKNSDINSIFYHTLIRTYQKLPYETVIHLEAQYILAFDQIMDKIDPNC